MKSFAQDLSELVHAFIHFKYFLTFAFAGTYILVPLKHPQKRAKIIGVS